MIRGLKIFLMFCVALFAMALSVVIAPFRLAWVMAGEMVDEMVKFCERHTKP